MLLLALGSTAAPMGHDDVSFDSALVQPMAALYKGKDLSWMKEVRPAWVKQVRQFTATRLPGVTQLSQHEQLLQVPLACLPKDFMTMATNLTLDDVTKLGTSPACHQATSEGKKLSNRLHSHLAKMQQGGGICRHEQLSTTEMFDTGFGGTMHSLVKPLMLNFARGLTMLTPRMPGWAGADCGNTMACFFQPLAPTCEGTDPLKVLQKHNELFLPGTESFRPPAVHVKVWGTAFNGEDPSSDLTFSSELNDYQSNAPYVHNFVNQNMVRQCLYAAHMHLAPCARSLMLFLFPFCSRPPRSQSHRWHGDSVIPEEVRPMGWFRYMTQLQGYLWRPSARLQAKLDERMQQTGLADALASRNPVIGMHVRHGDACGDQDRGRHCQPLSAYMKYADRLRAQTGASTIYLATDSEDVLRDTAKFPNYRFLHNADSMELPRKLKRTLNMTTLWWDIVYRTNVAKHHEHLNREVADHSIIEMMMLGKANLFVGKATSNFYRAALELKAASCDCMPAFYSLDSPWCFDFVIKAGVDVDGDKHTKHAWAC